jgi:hypothetical protein
MKRVLAAAAVLIVAGLAAAAAATACEGGTLALDDHPSLVAPATITLDASGLESDNDYTVVEFRGPGCDSEPVDSRDGTTAVDGHTFSVTFESLAAGVYSFQTYFAGEEEGPVTNCLTVTIGAGNGVIPQVDNAFLCYSVDQSNPGVWPMDVARQLLKQGGYWTPYAVQGNVAGGTNIGGYHLACNLASTQSASDSTLGGAGETDGPGAKQDVTNVAGYYPIVGA